jgi:hypothetical protein
VPAGIVTSRNWGVRAAGVSARAALAGALGLARSSSVGCGALLRAVPRGGVVLGRVAPAPVVARAPAAGSSFAGGGAVSGAGDALSAGVVAAGDAFSSAGAAFSRSAQPIASRPNMAMAK